MAKLYDHTQYFTTVLSKSGGLNTTDTVGLVLQSLSGVDDPTRPGVAAFTFSDPLDTSKVEFIPYTSINTGTKELQGVTRGGEGFSAKNHADNCTVAFPLSKSALKALRDKVEASLYNSTNDTWLTYADLTNNYNSIYRQAIINGNFDVGQRGTSFTNPTSGTFTLDRYLVSITNTGTLPTTIIHSQQAQTPGDVFGSGFFYRINTNGAGSGFGVNDQYSFGQRIENGTRYLCGASKQVTVSFRARSSITGKKIGIYLQQDFGTGGSPTTQEQINGTNFTLTSSWATYSYTFTTNTLSGKTFGTNNNDFLNIWFVEMWGSTYATKVGAGSAETFVGSGNIDFSQLQVNPGSVALPFMPKSYGQELLSCQRYARPFPGVIVGQAYVTSAAYYSFVTGIQMRTTPTLTSGNYTTSGATGGNFIGTLAISSMIGNTIRLDISSVTGSPLVAGDATILIPPANAMLEAEL